jgi:hypothetical protein
MCTWKDNKQMDPPAVQWLGYIHLGEGKVQRRAFVGTVVNIQIQ